MKDFFPESLGQKHGCVLYMGACYTRERVTQGSALHTGARYTQQNTVISLSDK